MNKLVEFAPDSRLTEDKRTTRIMKDEEATFLMCKLNYLRTQLLVMNKYNYVLLIHIISQYC